MEPIVTVRGVSHFFGEGANRRRVLTDVSADVMPGEIVIVTGPSGSGKTTLLTLVGGLRSLQHGRVTALGRDLYGASYDDLVRLRERIGFIFQTHNLLPALTARQNVQMALQVGAAIESGEARRRACEMLAAVGLKEHVDSYPRHLSGGQRQRVAIARALVRQPGMILADEPTAALDKQSGREVVDLLHSLAEERNCAILLVTHDNRILDIADRILTLEDGRLASGSSGLATHTEYVLNALQRRGELQRQAVALSAPEFVELVDGFSSEFEQLTRTLDTARQEVTGILVDETIEAITRKLRQVFRADRTSVYVMDRTGRTLRSNCAFHNGAAGVEVVVPVGTGAAGRAAASRQTVSLAARAGEDSVYGPIDALPGFRAHSVLSTPILGNNGEVIAVAELVNRVDGGPFTPAERQKLEELAAQLGIILQRCVAVQPQEIV